MKEINVAREVNDYRKGLLELSKRRNIAKLENELGIVQKRKRERTITARDIVQSIVRLEERLGLPQRCLNGMRVRIDCNAQDYANAYKGTPYSTQFEAEYRDGGWKITSIERCEARRNGRKHKFDILAISDEAKVKIVENAMKNINW